MADLKQTPLTGWHRDHGGKLVGFAGWEMPIRYGGGVLHEHQTVRTRCGIFDVSHMGELEITGEGARAAVDRLVTNDVARLEIGQVLYSALCREDGTTIDDLLVYCFAEDRFWIVCNAANHQRVADWVLEHLPAGVTLDDRTAAIALFAVQGPASLDVLLSWPGSASWREALAKLDYYRFLEVEIGGHPAVVSRTGYTGEKGYEIYLAVRHATAVWEELLVAGEPSGLEPIGLGARDTLRLEAGYSLYGHELDDGITPLEAGIGWVVKLKGADFIGRDALARQREEGPSLKTVALRLEGRNIPRQGAVVSAAGEAVGEVTSGSFSPTLETGIGLARVRASAAGEDLAVEIRGEAVPAETVKLPFVPARVRD